MPNGLPIDIETFEELPPDKQSVAIYKALVHMLNSGFECAAEREEYRKSCSQRIAALEKRNLRDKSFAGGAGLIGGFLASLFKAW